MKEMFSNRYKLIDKLGQGGLGEVYCAFDSWEGRKIALKLTNQESLTSEEIENFKEEYKLLKQLRHPGLVEAYDFSYSDGLPYFSMEYAEGRSLEQVFKEGGWEDLKILVAELCEVLGFIHLRGIIHCDLKPDNIKVTRSPFKIKLLDFGLAEEKGEKVNQDPKGTLEFMSPEVFQKEPLDERSDLYSLGVILYQAVTSQLPFSYSEPMQLISAHLEEEPKPPKELNPQIPDSLNELTLKLLAKNPEERFKNAWELKGILEDEKTDLAQKSFPTQHLFSGGLVGRENEISKLWNGLQTALKIEGKFFLVEGEAGIGKTALLDELKLKSQLAGVHFFRVRCLEKESQTYTPLIEAVTHLFPYLKNRCRLLIAKYSQPLEILIPQLEEEFAEKWDGQDESSYGASSASDKESLLSGLADFLVEASIIFPFALCFEDLGWAGSDTISFLKRLGESINKSRIFLCASLRAEKMEQKKDVNELINSLTNKDHFEIVRLDRFGLRETSDFVASKLAQSQPPGEVIDYLFGHTSGNPLFLTEILKFLIQKGVISLKGGEWLFDLENLKRQEVPKQIGNVLLNNLNRYDENTKKFLELSSIIGPRFDLESIKFLSTLSDDEVFEILFVLLKDEVIHKIPEQPELTYEFSSQSLQKLLYEKHTPSQRKKLHLKLGNFLEQKEKDGIAQPKEMLAFHYVNSTDYQKAYKYSLQAADQTKKRFAHNRTLTHIENALKSSQKLKDKGKYLDALMQRGDLYNSIGDLDKALKDYKEILKKTEGVKDERFMGEVCRHLGVIYREKHKYSEAIVYLGSALDFYQKTRDAVRTADVLSSLGTAYRDGLEYEEALGSFSKALRMLKELNDARGTAFVLNNIGILYKLQGEYGKSIQYYEQYLKIAQRLKDDMLTTKGLNNLGVNYVIIGRFAEAEKCFLQTLEINERIGYRKGTALNFENLGEVYLRMGDYERALQHFQGSLEIDREIGLPKLGISMQGIGLCYLESGNYQQAGEYLNQSLKHTIEIRDDALQVEIMLNLARMSMVLNDIKNAEIILDKAFVLIDKLKDKKLLSDFYRISGLFLFKKGETEESIKHLKKSEKLIEQLGLKNEKLLLNLDYCKIYSHLGQNDKVKEFLDESQKILKSISSQAQRPDFYLLLAQQKASQGKIQPGIGDLKTALVEAEKLEKPEILWRIHHSLGKLCIQNKDYEAGYKELESAFKIIKEIAQKIEDSNLRESYMKDKKELVEDLKSVAGVMVRAK